MLRGLTSKCEGRTAVIVAGMDRRIQLDNKYNELCRLFFGNSSIATWIRKAGYSSTHSGSSKKFISNDKNNYYMAD